ncbi:hypothetical protein HMPREF1531_01711 [Propionibacterium sp. oral taxon 192 str. F0372]|uniref:Type 1 glutamine amidotransferase-like domain-containing protein n=1 Tax=Propionibacterium sp. oral taxon 192 TaxID=671222 RepID=UPI00035320FC|nr:peptidase E [Propionibacterium sp. oral taxon 192]EPH02405.1 hypothetical protein HMPREF1531_01711 [Propionibacterium sp. oral taxon 192 str. F0372]
MTAHILTMGGGGFSMTENGAPTNLDRYLVELTGKRTPLVCFAPTASADDASYIHRFLTAYGAMGMRTSVLTLWNDAAASVAQLARADLLVVGGGNTVNLLALWRAHGVDRLLTERITNGDNIVLGGLSAGAACWYDACLSDAFGDLRPVKNGLGVLSGSFCPHWDGESERQPVFTDAIANGALPGGYAVDDGAALHWINGKLAKAVTEREGARALRMSPSSEPTTSGVAIERLNPELL